MTSSDNMLQIRCKQLWTLSILLWALLAPRQQQCSAKSAVNLIWNYWISCEEICDKARTEKLQNNQGKFLFWVSENGRNIDLRNKLTFEKLVFSLTVAHLTSTRFVTTSNAIKPISRMSLEGKCKNSLKFLQAKLLISSFAKSIKVFKVNDFRCMTHIPFLIFLSFAFPFFFPFLSTRCIIFHFTKKLPFLSSSLSLGCYAIALFKVWLMHLSRSEFLTSVAWVGWYQTLLAAYMGVYT